MTSNRVARGMHATCLMLPSCPPVPGLEESTTGYPWHAVRRPPRPAPTLTLSYPFSLLFLLMYESTFTLFKFVSLRINVKHLFVLLLVCFGPTLQSDTNPTGLHVIFLLTQCVSRNLMYLCIKSPVSSPGSGIQPQTFYGSLTLPSVLLTYCSYLLQVQCLSLISGGNRNDCCSFAYEDAAFLSTMMIPCDVSCLPVIPSDKQPGRGTSQPEGQKCFHVKRKRCQEKHSRQY